MAARLLDVVSHLDATLEIGAFSDYAPNGLQVEGAPTVRRVVTGVSASLELFEAAAAVGADLVVVHHGLVWGAGLPRVEGVVARRLAFLLGRGMSLAAYHLPLDAHPRLGNNAGLAEALGLGEASGRFGDVRGHALGWLGRFPAPVPRDVVLARVAKAVGQPGFVFPFGPAEVRAIGLCTGAASDLVIDAARAGCDLYLTGELAERAGALARELGVTLVAAGHHATEVFGPERLAGELERAFPGLEARFVNVPSPI
jgi:dinuclear metal center YbgI/SA1388 family protein